MRWVEYVTRMGETRDAYSFVVGTLRERSGLIWEDNVNMDLQQIRSTRSVWLRMGTVVNTVMNLRFCTMQGIS
jgi:hypothetical protein